MAGRDLQERLLELALAQEQTHALLLLDTEARIVGWLAGAARVLGYGQEEMLGHGLDRLLAPEDLARGSLASELRAAHANGGVASERWLVRKDGKRVFASGVLTPLEDDDGRIAGYALVVRDRTDQQDRWQSLQSRAERAAHLEHGEHVALGTLAHELRNPLGPLMMAAHTIRMLAADAPRIGACVQIIERQVRFIENVVRDLLESTRVGLGKVQLHYQEVPLRQVVDGALETCSTILDGQGQRVHVTMPEQLALEADAVRLQQVIVNLVVNAAKFSPPGSAIRLVARRCDRELDLRVGDDGRGIAPEMLSQVFEPFAQTGGDEAGDGLGLGLALVRSIVETHGGSVQAASDGHGKGTEITVRLPLARPEGLRLAPT